MGHTVKENQVSNYQSEIICSTNLGEIVRIPALEFYNETEPKITESFD